MGGVRTICCAGHSGSGKTTLIKALMKLLGTPVELGTSEEEKARGATIDLAVVTHKKGDSILTLIDTPGFAEFIEEVYKGLRVSETGLLVVNGEKGVEVQTELAWQVFKSLKKPAVAFVNRMDLPNASFSKCMDSLRQQDNFVPLELPIRGDGAFIGYMNLITMEPRFFDGKSGALGAELHEEAKMLREQLLEGLSMVDDSLMEKFLAEQPIPAADVEHALHTGMLGQVLYPVLCGSAAAALGLKQLLHILQDDTPTFDEEEQVGQAFRGLVFSVTQDPYLGTLSYTKLYGPVKEGQVAINVNTGVKETLKEISTPLGDKPQKVNAGAPGEVVVLSKLSEIALGDTLASDAQAPKLELAEFPKPIFSRALAPSTQADEEKMSIAFREVTAYKATLDFKVDEVTHEFLLVGMGEGHLNAAAERVKSRYKVSVTMKRPQMPYKETIRKTSEAQYRHKKQSGGRGQFGEVHLRVSPLPTGYEFVDEIKGAVIPNQYMPAVEKGIQEALKEGVLAGYPLDGVRVSVFYGKHHEVDSSEIAFKIAAAQAFKLAMQEANPALLEPIVKLTVLTPREYTGDIMSSLSGKRGKILGMGGTQGNVEMIEAEIPLAEAMEYAIELKSLTQGRATFQQEFLKYQVVSSAKLAEELLKREGKEVAVAA